MNLLVLLHIYWSATLYHVCPLDLSGHQQDDLQAKFTHPTDFYRPSASGLVLISIPDYVIHLYVYHDTCVPPPSLPLVNGKSQPPPTKLINSQSAAADFTQMASLLRGWGIPPYDPHPQEFKIAQSRRAVNRTLKIAGAHKKYIQSRRALDENREGVKLFL